MLRFALPHKSARQSKTTCHCEAGAHTGRGNPHPLCTARKRTADPRKTDSHVASAPRNDNGGLDITFSFP
nr:MAG TPA: hypothetical protein [Caudoviricetes sp.]